MALAPVRKSSHTTCISMFDDAIDQDASNKTISEDGDNSLEYASRRLINPSSWRDSVKFKDGYSPTEFKIGVVPPSDLVSIEDECIGAGRMRELYWKCFLRGVRDITNGPADENGKVPKKDIGGIEYVEPSWLADTFCGNLRMVAIEIGQNIYAWNQLKQVEVKN